MFKNLTIGKQIALGFTIILIFLGVISTISITGIKGIVNNAKEVIGGNQLRGITVQREVDHLNWANQVGSLINDDLVTELKVQVDPHKCGFGKWFYSDERKDAEKMVPEIKPYLSEIEKFHKDLHDSAAEIKEVFEPADVTLPQKIIEMELGHFQAINVLFSQMINKSQPELIVVKYSVQV